MNPTKDPLQFVLDALAPMPDDPTQTTAADVRRLEAVHEELGKFTVVHRADWADLANRVNAGAGDGDGYHRARHELAQLDVIGERATAAMRRLERYTRAALAARGTNLADLLGDD